MSTSLETGHIHYDTLPDGQMANRFNHPDRTGDETELSPFASVRTLSDSEVTPHAIGPVAARVAEVVQPLSPQEREAIQAEVVALTPGSAGSTRPTNAVYEI